MVNSSIYNILKRDQFPLTYDGYTVVLSNGNSFSRTANQSALGEKVKKNWYLKMTHLAKLLFSEKYGYENKE